MKCTTCATELDSRATFCPNCGATVPDPLIGTTIGGRYEASKRIAIGSFGSIYRGTDTISGKEIALKIMHRELAGDSNLVERFRREGVVLRKLLSRNVPKTFELGEADGLPFIAMEMLYGETLLGMLRKNGPMPWKRMFRIGAQVCTALGEAHDLGIVHRDLKPANIFVTEPQDPKVEGEVVKVLDFGIAKILSSSELANPRELTIMGTAVGTLEYMAPEQLMGGRADGRTDIYTLGVVMYEMIVGHRPFNVAGLELLTVQLTEPPPKPSEFVDVPPVVDEILLKCMHADIDERYQDVRLLQRAFDEIHAEDDFEPPVPTPRPPMASAARPATPAMPMMPPRPMVPLPLTPPMLQTEPVGKISPSKLPYVIVAVIVLAGIIAIALIAK
ncbi:MAG TPA: serine/threonine-protein kinase [Kofleriaceae bacterium]|jgi:serine/threonine protein kinase|nr:serine/threonine-protein kinase [Kofleriaceae bacterium]